MGGMYTMRQKVIKRILALSMVVVMAFALVACATTSSQDEPSESQSTQEVETTSAPTPSEAPTPSPNTTPIPNEDEPSEPIPSQEPTPSEPTPTQEPTPTPSEDTTTKEPQEPITTQKPTPSQEPTQTPTPTQTTTTTPTTPPTSTPIHTHSFKGGDCSTPSTCDCGEVGSYGNHNWATRHIDAYGYYEKGETHRVKHVKCTCGFEVNTDMPNVDEIWDNHYRNCSGNYTSWYEDVPNGEPKWVEVMPAYDETYCTICGAIQ